ncbi:MAG: FAD-binding oxidoreductase [Chloroflexi bacterium]|nr:MAG: FAD-binding oxidoreductase [Chloroflexota bacterium]
MADKSLDGQTSNLVDERYNHRWGFTDSTFVRKGDYSVSFTGTRYALSGTEMPEFLPFVEEMLDIKLDFDNVKLEIEDKPAADPNINEGFMEALKKVYPESQYSFEKTQRIVHSHGQTTADEVYKVIYGRLERVVDLVTYPESDEDVEKLVALAQEHNVCLVPYGGGTSVSCALQLPASDPRMMVAVDMRRMDKIVWIDRENFRAEVQAGMTGKDLEEALEKEGFTTGHEPDSLELSTVGGWIATNASGMKKNRYGNIEDIVENVTMITARGLMDQSVDTPRNSIGMQPQQLLFGSEGNLGIITKAVMKIHKLPEAQKFGSLVFPNFKSGTDFLYELMRTGTLPASVRLLDNIQFRFGSALKPKPTTSDKLMSKLQKLFLLNIKGFDPNELCAATIVMEGTAEEVAFQSKLINRIAKKHRGIPGGSTNGQRGYMLTYAIAYIRDFLAEFEIIGETYETTVPWDKVHEVMEAVDKVAHEKHAEYNLPGKPYVSPRVTQLYHTGVCIYFTHGFSTHGVENPDVVFSIIEHALRETIMAHGGSVSHHHGVGKIRKDFMADTLSETSIELLKDIKQAYDPDNIFGIGNNIFAG